VPTSRQGSIRLFQFSGIQVFLHWSWFLIAAYEIQIRRGQYSSVTWNILEYVSLFVIVLLHEFGHSLACRSVGGRANQIVLWPLGGVAYVDPPPRPGATLWSIAAGPLVNVALLPILFVLLSFSRSLGWVHSLPDVHYLLRSIFYINVVLLVFNMLPVYPLDGGQILRSLLWFVLGRARSLMVATVIGLIGGVAFIGFAIWQRSLWYGAMAAFMLMNCWGGLKHALELSRVAKMPRHVGYACPACKAAPTIGEFWKCGNCGRNFDTFQTHAACPQCGTQYPVTRCMECGEARPMSEWAASV
jgi:Zn-dependent protease